MYTSDTILGIDQSLNATGLAVLERGRCVASATLRFSAGGNQMEKVGNVCHGIADWLKTYKPCGVAMEDYARQAHSSSLIPLVELGGCIKQFLYTMGYWGGIERAKKGDPFLLVQNQSNMKKFCLGTASIDKDAQYLAKVAELYGERFADDNQADAFMHAHRASVVRALIMGTVSIEGLPLNQQEALISEKLAKKKGLTKAKAMKLPPQDKMALIAY